MRNLITGGRNNSNSVPQMEQPTELNMGDSSAQIPVNGQRLNASPPSSAVGGMMMDITDPEMLEFLSHFSLNYDEDVHPPASPSREPQQNGNPERRGRGRERGREEEEAEDDRESMMTGTFMNAISQSLLRHFMRYPDESGEGEEEEEEGGEMVQRSEDINVRRSLSRSGGRSVDLARNPRETERRTDTDATISLDTALSDYLGSLSAVEEEKDEDIQEVKEKEEEDENQRDAGLH